MQHLQLGSANHVSQNFAPEPFNGPPADTHHVVEFAGGCIAIASVTAGKELDDAGQRKTTIVSAFIDETQIAQSGTIDYRAEDIARHNSPGPNTLTINVPVGSNGRFVVWAGKPDTFQVTLVRNVI